MKLQAVLKVLALVMMFFLYACSESSPYPNDKILTDKFLIQESSFLSLVSDPTNQDILDRSGIIDVKSFANEASVHTFIVWYKDIPCPILPRVKEEHPPEDIYIPDDLAG